MSPKLSSVLAVVVVVCAIGAAGQLSCDNVRCGWGATCELENGKPVCRCNQICLELYKPVCGSDGKTYPNQCYLQRAACQRKVSITVASQGECSARPTTKRSCPSVCPAVYKPICGSDHKQYSNECAMKVAACKSGAKITKVNEGGCESLVPTTLSPSSCQDLCTAEYKPVCSSDNVTYGNDCELDVAICRSGGRIRKEYDGACETFAPTPGPQACRRCPRGPLLPVCGSDGATYTNLCELERAACLEQRPIVKRQNGACDSEPKAGPKCPSCLITTDSYAGPVCGSDNKTYGDLCQLRTAACMEQRDIAVKFDRPCDKIKVCAPRKVNKLVTTFTCCAGI